jgi:deoxyribonuclease-4
VTEKNVLKNAAAQPSAESKLPAADGWHIRFGTAGESISFDTMGYKSSLDIPAYTARFDLHAFEYQCGRGVRLGLEKAAKMAALAQEKDILFSVHAPYFISMSSMEEEKRLNSIQYLLQSCAVVKALGGRRVIFHTGSCGKQSREAALEKALDTMRRAVEACDAAGYGDLTLCPETMGKIGQLGTLDEVLALCRVDARITPCIDFGHLNARTLGGIRTKQDYADILDRIGAALGDARAARFHVHFSRIEFTAGGEKRHWTLADTQFGPEPQPLLELLAERKLAPVIICESAGTQAEDAAAMQAAYRRALV